MSKIKSPVETQALDETKVEAALAYFLDSIAVSCNLLAERLRRSPYSAIETDLGVEIAKLSAAATVGDYIKGGALFEAISLINRIQTFGIEQALLSLNRFCEFKISGKSEEEIARVLEELSRAVPGGIIAHSESCTIDRVNKAGLCPNCGHYIGDFAECDKCLHSL
jgi:hypothetical protein